MSAEPNEIIIGGLIVKDKRDPIFGDSVTEIKLKDDAAGLFISVEQMTDINEGKFYIDPDEWPAIRKAIDKMVKIAKQQSENKTK